MRVIEINEKISTAGTVAGQAIYSLPADLDALLCVRVGGVKLDRIQEGHAGTGDETGKPTHFSCLELNMPCIRLWPAPAESGSNNIEVIYEPREGASR